MKNALVILLLTTSVFVYAQTTMEEYNYVTKGYKAQIESGLTKPGYEVLTIDRTTSGTSSIALCSVTRTKGFIKEIAAYMIIYQSGTNMDYVCLPHPNSGEDVRAKFWDHLYTTSADELVLITYLLNQNLNWQWKGF